MQRWISVVACLAVLTAARGEAPSPPEKEKYLTPEVERAIDKGLAFLATKKQRDGSIQAGGHPVGATAIALLAFLANGHLPGRGTYGELVEDATRFLLKAQDRHTGMIGQSMYEHGFSLLALSDVWGETKDEDHALQDGIESAVNLALQAQKNNPAKGWHYSPQMQSEDISVSSAVLQGLRAAREAYFNVPQQAMDDAATFLVQHACRDGGFSYQMRQEGSNMARTGIGVMGLLACGRSDRPEVMKGVEYLRQRPHFPERTAYSAYYAVLAMYQARTLAGDRVWDEWYPKIQNQMLKSQKKDGSYSSESSGGPVVECGLMTVALSVQKGLLPLFQR